MQIQISDQGHNIIKLKDLPRSLQTPKLTPTAKWSSRYFPMLLEMDQGRGRSEHQCQGNPARLKWSHQQLGRAHLTSQVP